MKMSVAGETNNNDKNKYGGGGPLTLGRPVFTTDVDFNTEWEGGLGTMRRLLSRKNVSQKEWQALFFTNSQITCWATNGCELLFGEFKREIRRHVSERAELIFQTTAALSASGNGQDDGLDLLRRYVAEWDNYWVLCQYLPLPFNFIEKEDMRLKRSNHGGSATRRRLPPQQPKLFDLGGNGAGASSHSHQPQLVRDAMLECWNRMIFDKISDRLLSAAMQLVERERLGELIEQRLVIGIRQSFVELNVDSEQQTERYTRHFEQSYIERSEAFYRDRGREVFETGGTLAYMQYADEKLVEEEARARLYLHSTPEYESESIAHQNQLVTANRFLKGFTESANLASKQTTSVERLLARCVHVLVIGYEERLLELAEKLIAERGIDRLKQLYRLINRTPSGISILLSQLAAHISREGTAAMRANAATILRDSEKFVEQLLSMYTHFSALTHDAFYNDSRFLTVRDQAFQEVVNSTEVFSMEIAGGAGRGVLNVESRCPQLLANYSDLLLRRSAKHLSSDEVDEKLNNLLLVLKYVRNKDVFMRYYKTNLSHRLIFEMVTDQDREEQLVTRFREAGMPADFVHKLARMLTDMEMSNSLNEEFKRSLPHQPTAAYSDSTLAASVQQLVSVKVLNAGAWSRTTGGPSGIATTVSTVGNHREASAEPPSAQHHGLTLPTELDEYMSEVESYYKKKYSGRKLNWAHHWSTGTITFANEMGRFEVKVTAHQLAILFAWNARPYDKIRYEQLRLTGGLSDVELSRALTSMLANPKLPNPILLTDHSDEKSGVEGRQSSQIGALALPRFHDSTQFWLNQKFCVMKGERTQPRGKINLIGRLQLSQAQEGAGGGEVHQQEHEEIRQLRELRIQEAIVKIMKMRRQATQAQLHTELVDVLKGIFLPSKRLIKEQIEWLFDKGYLRRHPDDINTFIYCT